MLDWPGVTSAPGGQFCATVHGASRDSLELAVGGGSRWRPKGTLAKRRCRGQVFNMHKSMKCIGIQTYPLFSNYSFYMFSKNPEK